MSPVATADFKPVADKVFLANVTLSIGMLSTLGNLYTVAVPNAGKDEEFKTVCPSCASPTEFLSQKYVCKENKLHGPFVLDDVKNGKIVDGKMMVVDREKVAETRASVLPERSLELQVHLRSEVEGKTFAKGNVYVFQPSGRSAFYSILFDLLQERRDIVLLAKTNMKKTDHFMMVDIENGQLVVRDMLWPSDTKVFAAVDAIPYKAKDMAQVKVLIESSIEDFVPDEYKKDGRERLSAMVDEISGQPPVKGKKKKPAVVADEDLSDLIAASIALRQKKQKKAS